VFHLKNNSDSITFVKTVTSRVLSLTLQYSQHVRTKGTHLTCQHTSANLSAPQCKLNCSLQEVKNVEPKKSYMFCKSE